MSLLTARRFLPLFITQFLGAFNDNLFKNALVMLLTYRLALAPGQDPQTLVTLASAIFILPFFLFSATAGQLADRYDRAVIARRVKQLEILLAMCGIAAFASANLVGLYSVLFGFGLHSTFFGPVKYALLPQHLRPQELLAGNAYIEAATFLAILLGTLGGGLIILYDKGETLLACVVMACAIAGYVASRWIPAAPTAMPDVSADWNVMRSTWRVLRETHQRTELFPLIFAISWFWLVGATFLSQFPGLAKHVLHADGSVVTLLLTVFSVGIGIGSFLCTLLPKTKHKLLFVPWACLGVSLFTLDACWALSHYVPQSEMIGASAFFFHAGGMRATLDLLCVAICGGAYIVPLYTMLQEKSDATMRARVIAANNIVNACFMVIAALATVALLAVKWNVPQILQLIACLNLIVCVLLWRKKYT